MFTIGGFNGFVSALWLGSAFVVCLCQRFYRLTMKSWLTPGARDVNHQLTSIAQSAPQSMRTGWGGK